MLRNETPPPFREDERYGEVNGNPCSEPLATVQALSVLQYIDEILPSH